MSKFYIHLFSWGDVAHGNGDFTVDREFYAQMKGSYDFLTKSDDRPPQYPPIKRQHMDDGFGYGLIVDLFSTDEQPAPEGYTSEGVYIEVLPSPVLSEWRDQGLIVDYSPGFADEWKDPHTGQTLKNVLRECSFVSDGHLKNTQKKSPAYALSASGFITTLTLEAEMAEMPDEKEKKMEEEDMGARLEALEEHYAAFAETLETLAGQVGRIVAAMGDEEESEMEEEHEDKDMTNMAARVSQLEKQLSEEKGLRLKAQAEAALDRSGVELESEDRERLVSLAAKDADAFASTVKLLSSTQKKVKELSATDAHDPFREIGAVGSVDAGTGNLAKFRELCAEIKKSEPNRYEAVRKLGAQKAINHVDPSDVERKYKVIDQFWPAS